MLILERLIAVTGSGTSKSNGAVSKERSFGDLVHFVSMIAEREWENKKDKGEESERDIGEREVKKEWKMKIVFL